MPPEKGRGQKAAGRSAAARGVIRLAGGKEVQHLAAAPRRKSPREGSLLCQLHETRRGVTCSSKQRSCSQKYGLCFAEHRGCSQKYGLCFAEHERCFEN